MWEQRHFDAALVAAGQMNKPWQLTQVLKRYRYLVAVDGGLQHIVAMGLVPDVLVGDLDSVQHELIKQESAYPILDYPTDKDESDLELALQLGAVQQARQICIFGATGGRIDHTISNLRVLAKNPERIALETETERICVLPRQARLILEPGTQLSLMPLFEAVEGLTTRGLVWNLDQATLNQNLVSLSNRAADPEILIEHKSGTLICTLFKN